MPPSILMTTKTTATLMTPGGVWVYTIDKDGIHFIKWSGEMGDPTETDVTQALLPILTLGKGPKELEAVRADVVKLLVSMAETAVKKSLATTA